MSTHRPNPIETLATAILEQCEARELQYVKQPEELSKDITRSAALQGKLQESSDEAQRRQTRNELNDIASPYGLFVKSHSSYAIQIGQLDDDLMTGEWQADYRQKLLRRWHAYQQYAAIARTWLLTDYSDDLNLFLVGPIGSGDEAEWKNFCEVIERNELVCRKLVWLPKKHEEGWSDEVEAFLERTFLAEPWEQGSSRRSTQLDALSDSADNSRSWLEILDRPEFRTESRDYDALVKEILKSEMP